MATNAQRQAHRELTEAFERLKAAENEVNQATDEHNNSTDTLTVRDQQRLLSGSVKDILTLRAYIVNAIRHKRHMVQLTENLLRVYDEYMQRRSANGLPDRPKEDREESARILDDLKRDIVFLEKSSRQVLERMVEKDKESKSEKKENKQMGAEDIDTEKVHEAALDYHKFKDMPKLQTGEDSEEERDAQQKYGRFLGAQREYMRMSGTGLPDRGNMFHQGMNHMRSGARMIGRGNSYVAKGEAFLHRTNATEIVLDKAGDGGGIRPLYCTRVNDNPFGVGHSAPNNFFYEAKENLRMFRWGSGGEAGINKGDLDDFSQLVRDGVDKRYIAQAVGGHIMAVFREAVRGVGPIVWKLNHETDAALARAVGPLLRMSGYNGWVRDTDIVTEYLFCAPGDDLVYCGKEIGDPVNIMTTSPQLRMSRFNRAKQRHLHQLAVQNMRRLERLAGGPAAGARDEDKIPTPKLEPMEDDGPMAGLDIGPPAAAAQAAAGGPAAAGGDPYKGKDVYQFYIDELKKQQEGKMEGEGMPHTLSVLRKKRRHAPTAEHADVAAVNNRRVSRMVGTGGDLHGKGMPQHMLRGSYFASGVNR